MSTKKLANDSLCSKFGYVLLLETAKLEVLLSSSECDMKSSRKSFTLTFDKTIPNKIKRRIGFEDLFEIVSCAPTIFRGNFDVITKTTSDLMWLEDWMLCFEFSYGESLKR